MRGASILPVALALVSVWVALAAGIATVWLTEGVRAAAPVILPAAVVAALLVLYFDWRTTLRRRMLADRTDDGLDEAA